MVATLSTRTPRILVVSDHMPPEAAGLSHLLARAPSGVSIVANMQAGRRKNRRTGSRRRHSSHAARLFQRPPGKTSFASSMNFVSRPIKPPSS